MFFDADLDVAATWNCSGERGALVRFGGNVRFRGEFDRHYLGDAFAKSMHQLGAAFLRAGDVGPKAFPFQ